MADKLVNKYSMDSRERAQWKQFLGIIAEDEQTIRTLNRGYQEVAALLSEGFYQHLLSFEETANFLQDPELLARLKRLQMDHFKEMVSGDYGEDYFERRLRIGEVHEKVGLEPIWYLGAFSQYLQIAVPAFAEQTGGKITPEVLAILKLILLDISLSLKAYFARAAEHLSQRNQELKQALQMYLKAELRAKQYAKLAGHEIRSSLNAIAAACESAEQDFLHDPAVAREMLQAAQRRCLQTAAVVESILSEPENAGQPAWVETSEILREVSARLDLYSTDRHVELILPAESVRVWADAIGLREVFANLVSNAIRHLDKDLGRVSIEYLSDSPEEHVFCVADNGPGIPPEIQDRIFEPFFRGPTNPHQGKGLGLHFVCAIIAQHGGRVWVESVLATGSRFYFSLPRQPRASHAQLDHGTHAKF